MAFLLESEDLPKILPLAEICFREFKYPGKFNVEHFIGFWRRALDVGTGHVLSSWDSGKLVGIMGFMEGQDQFTAAQLCLVNWWFVLPEYRHKGYGSELLRDVVSFAQFRECKRILMGHPPGHDEFFKKHGFSPIETGYHKTL